MSSINATGAVTDYLMQMDRLRSEAVQQARQRQALMDQYKETVTDALLSQRVEAVRTMLEAGKVEFKTGLVVNTTA